MSHFSLARKVAVVTGASSGLGVHFALGLAEAEADLVICARRAQRLEQTRESVELLGRRCLAVEADVTRADDCERPVSSSAARRTSAGGDAPALARPNPMRVHNAAGCWPGSPRP